MNQKELINELAKIVIEEQDNRKEIEEKKKIDEALIQGIELEISKANSVEFEIKD